MVRVKVRVNKKGEIVIPKIFRDKYHILPGEDVFIRKNNQKIIIEKPI